MSDTTQPKNKNKTTENGSTKAKAEKEPRHLQTFATVGADFACPAPDELFNNPAGSGFDSATGGILSHEPSALLQRRIATNGVGVAVRPASLPAFTGKNFGGIPAHPTNPPKVQTKLTVGAAHDPYEEEADEVAEQVMRLPAPTFSAPAGVGDPGQRDENSIQRVVEEEDEIQTKPLAATIRPFVQRTMPKAEDEEVQRAAEEEDELRTKRMSAADSFETGDDFEDRVAATRGGGSPLPAEVRTFMEPRFGADFSGVRLHADGEAAELNRSVSAQAFTLGQDIYLGAGKTDVTSDGGKRLLAHELTHVVQQGGTNQLQRVPNSTTQKTPPTTSVTTKKTESKKGVLDRVVDILEGIWDVIQVILGIIVGILHGIVKFLYDMTIGLVVDILVAIGYLLGSLIHGISYIIHLLFGTKTVFDDSWHEVRDFFVGIFTAVTHPLEALKAIWGDFVKEFKARKTFFGKAEFVTATAVYTILSIITIVKAAKGLGVALAKKGKNVLEALKATEKSLKETEESLKATKEAETIVEDLQSETRNVEDQIENPKPKSETAKEKTETKSKSSPVWEKYGTERGKTIEHYQAKAFKRQGIRRLPKNFKAIDFVEGGTTTSLRDQQGKWVKDIITDATGISEKSIDLRGASFKTAKSTSNYLKKYFSDLHDFTSYELKGVEVTNLKEKVINLRFGPLELSAEQAKGIAEFVDMCKMNKIKVNVSRF